MKQVNLPFGLAFTEISASGVDQKPEYSPALEISIVKTNNGQTPFVTWAWEFSNTTGTRNDDADAPGGDTVTTTKTIVEE